MATQISIRPPVPLPARLTAGRPCRPPRRRSPAPVGVFSPMSGGPGPRSAPPFARRRLADLLSAGRAAGVGGAALFALWAATRSVRPPARCVVPSPTYFYLRCTHFRLLSTVCFASSLSPLRVTPLPVVFKLVNTSPALFRLRLRAVRLSRLSLHAVWLFLPTLVRRKIDCEISAVVWPRNRSPRAIGQDV